MLACTSEFRYDGDQLQVYKTHTPLWLINLVTPNKWYAVEHITQVNADKYMLRILTEAQGVDDEAERWHE